MVLFNQTIKFDKKNRVVKLEITNENVKVAEYIYSEKDGCNINGSIKDVYGIMDTEEDNMRYEKILKANEFLCMAILDQNK